MLSTVKVPSDPAEVVVNHASFRVRLGASSAPAALSPSVAARAALATAAHPRPAVAATATRRDTAFEDTEPIPVAAGAARRTAGAPARRRAPVVWSGGAEPDDTGATKVIQAARTAGLVGFTGHPRAPADTDTPSMPSMPSTQSPSSTSSTQTLPRVGDLPPRGGPATVVGPPRGPQPSENRPVPPPTGEPLLKGVRPARGAFDDLDGPDAPSGPPGPDAEDTGELATIGHEGPYEDTAGTGTDNRRRREALRNAYYPGRRMNLGVVLLPLRVFLGLITVYAGMGKLCDPVYFDGGERGSMVTWLRSLHPWTIASPLRDFALAHPVGAGLTVAFLQVIVGVLTIFGLWQRVAAGVGALLSAALLLTVSWRTVPAYEAPDIIYLAAWSPLIIAGAPVFSVDGRLAGEAWRKLGPRVSLWDLRRRVLRRGTLIASVIIGLALLVGSLLGSAVRSAQSATGTQPGKTPTNRLPGSPMPGTPGAGSSSGQATRGPDGGADGRRDGTDRRRDGRTSTDETRPGEGRATSGPETTPTQGATQGPGQGTTSPQEGTTAPPPQQQSPQQPQATTGTGTGSPNGLSRQSADTGGSASTGSGGGTSTSGGGSGGGRGALGGLLGR